MKVLNGSNEDEMVLAFLKGEIDSPRFGNIYQNLLMRDGRSRTDIIDGGNLQDHNQNAIRKKLLGDVRGYDKGTFLFTKFPNTISWFRIELSRADFEKMKYANHITWKTLTQNSRLVSDGARNYKRVSTGENVEQNVEAIIHDIGRGKDYSELILVSKELDGEMILVEGHTRATVYYVIQRDSVPAILGVSPDIDRWAFF